MECVIYYENKGTVSQLTVSRDTDVDTLKDLIQVELEIPREEQEIHYNGKKLNDNESLRSIDFKHHDLIFLKIQQLKQPPQQQSQQNHPSPIPSNLNNTKEQRHIEEHIRQQNIQENLQNALEFTPEAFGRVVMLYIPCKINQVPVRAFVDTGAQTTIMSRDCAEKCNLLRLVDSRFGGVAVGVGSAPILGRVHLAQMQIGKTFFPISLSIIGNTSGGPDLILGLDQLKKHGADIHLLRNTLTIGGEVVSFLAEKDLLSVENFLDEQQNRQSLNRQQIRTTSQNGNIPDDYGNPVASLLQMV